jgi:hypothetical protein
MGGLTKTVGSALFSLLFVGTIALAAHYIPKNLEGPKPIPPKPEQVEFIGPNYCTPGIEADHYRIRDQDTTYRLIVKYDLEMEDIEKYNSKRNDFTGIVAGGTLCLPPGTLENYLK